VRGLPKTIAIVAVCAAAIAAAGCGKQSVAVPAGDADHTGATLFAQRCAGCHTLKVAGTQGSGTRAVRAQGPNLDQRSETYEDVLFAIENGGFSGSIMPQNIVVGDDATAVARFVEKYAGSEAQSTARPGQTTTAPGGGP
jgi:mono/diheme cytochrome c family protein